MPDPLKKHTIELTCPQLGTTDYLTFDEITTFNDLINELKEKYATDVLEYMKNFQNIRRNISLEEITIKMHHIDRQGTRQTIGLFTKVKELRNKISGKVYWEAEPIGGIKNL